MIVLDTADGLKDWGEYRLFMRERLKMLPEETGPIFISKTRLDFQISGKPWKGYAIVLGKKARTMAQKLRREGVLFLEGTCTKTGKQLAISGFSDKFVEGASRTLTRLKLGYEATVGQEGAAASEAGSGSADLTAHAKRIHKAAQVWNQTRVAVTAELRKLQRAIQALKNARSQPVMRQLERIVTRLVDVGDEARRAAQAAAGGDSSSFSKAREDFVRKMQRMVDYARNDELIRDAEANPAVPVRISETLTTSASRLIKAV